MRLLVCAVDQAVIEDRVDLATSDVLEVGRAGRRGGRRSCSPRSVLASAARRCGSRAGCSVSKRDGRSVEALLADRDGPPHWDPTEARDDGRFVAPVSQARSTGVSRSASVADELSYSPVKQAHQNQRMSLARVAPLLGPEALLDLAPRGGQRDQHRAIGQPLATSTPHSLRSI